MKLSDVMSAAHLSFYAEVALALFLLSFVAIVFSLFSKKGAAAWEQARLLPLDDSESLPPQDPPDGAAR